MILSEQTFIELAGKQEVLDVKIKAAKGITELHYRKVELYYRVELGECINEMKGDFKHWSDKPMRRVEFMEEFVDALHFFLSYINHYSESRPLANLTVEDAYYELGENYNRYQDYIKWNKDAEYWDIALDAIVAKEIFRSFATLVYLVEKYDYTEQDIIDAYNKKNAVNHDRSDSGVY
ncbi:dUTP diphosphatase [Exiguobacterium sp. s5]|uniref:dUTP diphosphatase n=1 Tax=Exiguobacterium sp. s5 TaxID=2751239 RepID=UPI001BE8D21E|nr:dUTP diphosphatase [Exiguobacterium sp. s5]